MNGNAQKATQGQKLEIMAAIVKASPRILKGIVRNLSHEAAKKWIGDQKGLERVVGEAVRNALMPAQAKQNIGERENCIFKPTFTVVDNGKEIDVVVVSNADLGFRIGAYTSDTYKRAMEMGLELYSETNPEMIKLLEKIRIGERYLIIKKLFGGFLNVFNVVRDDDGSWLSGYDGHPDDRRDADDRFVFALPRK